MDIFALSDTPLEELNPFSPSDDSGAVVTFWGRVRNHNEGRKVLALEYSSYPELALKEGQRILAEARLKFPLGAIRAAHRIGSLKIGDGAVVVEVASDHRQEAFEACRWIIDEIKTRLPIWKKEHYEQGNPEWVMCNHSHSH